MGFWSKKKDNAEQAIGWLKNNLVNGEAVIVHTKERVAYPEVTGYYIPTLYNWGETDLAREFTRWLMSIQLGDGSFPAPGGDPYTFDTGQIMRGLNASISEVNGADAALIKACEWVLTQIDDKGQMHTPTTELWSDIADDLIHVYVLPPLKRAGVLLDRKEFVDAANFSLKYYKEKRDVTPFNRLSHFHAYAIEALLELDELELVRQGMEQVEKLQFRNGGVPAYPDVKWVCSTGIAQYAVIWCSIGESERAKKALDYLEKIQNPSGGWYGSYGQGAKYISGAEISWAVKYYLDARYLQSKNEIKNA